MTSPHLTGHSAQLDFEASLMQYRTQGRATGQRNYPEITQRGYVARVVGKATTDYTAFICQPARAVQFEVKTWESKYTHTIGFGGKAGLQLRQQWLMMRDFAPFVYTAYLVLWRWQGSRQWRLYPVAKVVEIDNGLLFERSAGVVVPEAVDGWPEWLEVIR